METIAWFRENTLSTRLTKLKTARAQEPVDIRNAKAIIKACNEIEGGVARTIAGLAEQMIPVLQGTHRIEPVGPATISSPGNPPPIMRDSSKRLPPRL